MQRKQIFFSTRHVAQDTFWKSSMGVLLNDCLIFGKFQRSVAYKSVAYKSVAYKSVAYKSVACKI